MKRLNNALILLFLMLATINNHVSASKKPIVTKGVSHQLATERKQAISNIVYKLDYVVPETMQQPVVGNVTIEFDYDGSQPLQIDFLPQSDSVPNTISVNGKRVKTNFTNEHFVISKRYLKRGHNEVTIEGFVANDKTLNRHDDYLYTLLVPDRARTIFPCFDQPDLKAQFILSLTIPDKWKAIANAPIAQQLLTKKVDSQPKVRPTMRQHYRFETTDLLPTYLFAFTVGQFEEAEKTIDGYHIQALYRQQTEDKVQQIDTVFQQIAHSLRWLEQYTDISQPFKKYGIVVLPGYQFGGMEHPGAIHLNEQRIFLRQNPTPDELLSRHNLIAHETAHLWFGDLVTMKWFSDVWTKEVFANFMADKMLSQQFPNINHEISFIKAHYPFALATDRTDGSNPIQQPLENLNQAGLLYGNIIYHKAPIMMKKLEQHIGKQAMQEGLRKYLKRYSFDNATWDNLIDCFNEVAPDANVYEFSHAWVKERGLPTVSYKKTTDDNGNIKVAVTETDPYNRNLHWQQNYEMPIVDNHVIPNINGDGYARFVLENDDAEYLLDTWQKLNEQQRMAAILTLYENYLMQTVTADKLFASLTDGLQRETNPLVASICISYAVATLPHITENYRETAENILFDCAESHTLSSAKIQLLRSLATSVKSPKTINRLYELWKNKTNKLLSERDYCEMAYRLAILIPEKHKEIINQQRQNIGSDDLKREFNFIAEACTTDKNECDKLFRKLLIAENRRVEPWAAATLRLLNSYQRQQQPTDYITPALDALEEIQRTGDIFFPADWLRALLSEYHSSQAKYIVTEWIEQHPQLPKPLMNKLKDAAHHLITMH